MPSDHRLVQPPTSLLCEYSVNPLGIDVTQPRFSWVPNHLERGQLQSAYQIIVGTNKENLDEEKADMWNSGKVESGQSVNVVYKGKTLESRESYYWKVCIWDKDCQVSPYSRTATFEMGFLEPRDWKGKWITGGNLLRREFTLNTDIKKARAYICGLGYYELRINGEKVGDHVLDPGWTDYKKKCLYVTYNIIEYLKEGKNCVAVMLGNGRYSPLDETVKKNHLPLRKYGDLPVLILQIHVDFTDGSRMSIVTDKAWKVAQGPIVRDDIYDGEVYDARLEKLGWDTLSYDDSDWESVRIADTPGGKLISQASFPPIKVIKIIQPLKISLPKPDMYIYDFGQNFAGWVRLRVSGSRGTKINLRYAELLDGEGTVNTAPNLQAKATDTYILRGDGEEIYEPRFTYHGFRYVEVSGFPSTPMLESIEGRVVHSAVEPIGCFVCSNSLINSIHKNVLWTQLSNLMSVPTDCPQRSERMGWLDDAQLTVEEAICNFNMAGFYTKWIDDIAKAQRKDGDIPAVVPSYWDFCPGDPVCSTACVVIPWHLYQYYGDKRILEKNYSTMKRWVDFLSTNANDYIVSYARWGDSCSPYQEFLPLNTPVELTSTWCYYHDVLVLSKIAHILGNFKEAKKYSQLSNRIKEAFNKKFFNDDHYAMGSQTSNTLPLFLGMVPKDKEKTVLKNLVNNVRVTHSNHLNTGIVGTRYILDVLTRYGQANLAYKIVTQTTYPGWGYMIREGATTIWERWEYLTIPGVSTNTSHNHIMLGTVDTWFYKTLAGINIDPAHPGFRKIIIRPHIVSDLNYVGASFKSIRGMVSSSWTKDDHSLILNVTLPVNTQGRISVPKIDEKNITIRENKKVVWENNSYVGGVAGITDARDDNGYVTFDVGSGSYSFEVGIQRR